jgi:hypothetical protein
MSILERNLKTNIGGIFPQLFMLFVLNTLYRKHTKIGSKNVSFSSHENLYLSKFLGHPSSMVLKLPTNHLRITWYAFPSKSPYTNSKEPAPSPNSNQ